MTGLWVAIEVWDVQSEEKQLQNSPLWCSCAADHLLRNIILQSHKLWSVCQVVSYPGGCGGTHMLWAGCSSGGRVVTCQLEGQWFNSRLQLQASPGHMLKCPWARHWTLRCLPMHPLLCKWLGQKALCECESKWVNMTCNAKTLWVVKLTGKALCKYGPFAILSRWEWVHWSR